jgi:hypothetical protein
VLLSTTRTTARTLSKVPPRKTSNAPNIERRECHCLNGETFQAIPVLRTDRLMAHDGNGEILLKLIHIASLQRPSGRRNQSILIPTVP